MRPENKHIIDYISMGVRIRDERLRRRIPPKELADQSNISVSALNEIERGVRRAGLTNLVLIASALDLSIDYLLYGKMGQAENADENENEMKIKRILNACTQEEQTAIIQVAEVTAKALIANRMGLSARHSRNGN